MLGYWEWLDGLERGLAAHHAGMLPAFKEVVEELFVRGLVKAVFATETLALGINMPARCVVLERLVKFNGEAHVDLTPGEYTQLTGRAGRRGIDVEGHAVVVWSPEIDPRQVAGLASTRTYPLRSSFRPSYNMAVNLVGTVGAEPARDAAGVLLRAVPGGPVGGRAGPAGAAQHRDDRGVRRGGRLPPRRLRRVLRAAGGDRRPGAGHRPAGADPAQGGGRAPRWSGCGSATSSGCRRGGGPAWPWCWTRRPAVSASPARWCSPRTAGPAGSAPATSPPRPRCWPGSGCRSTSTTGRRRPGGTSPPRSAAPGWTATVAGAAAAPARRSGEDHRLSRAARRVARAPLPRLPGPGGARPLGRASPPAGARHRGAAAAGGGPDRLAGPYLRPDRRAADRARLPGRRR